MSRLLLLVAIFLTFAPPAHAGGAIFSGGVNEVGGALLAGDRVAWATARDGVLTVHAAAHDGSGHTAQAVPTPPPFDIHASASTSASDRRVSVAFGRRYCVTGRECADDWRMTAQSTFSGALGEPLARIDPACAPEPGRAAATDTWGDVVAYHDPCADRTVVHDFATGAVRSFPASESAPRIAGPFLALLDARVLTVVEWATGAERLRVNGAIAPLDVQEDGKAAFQRVRDEGGPASPSAGTFWASPAQTEPRPVAPPSHSPPSAIALRIADDRVALTIPGGALEVRELDGDVVAQSREAQAHDFDGERVSWTTSPCAVVGIATWDLEGEPPAMPAGPCPWPQLRSRVVRADLENGRLAAKVVCPADSPLGCRGYLTVRAGAIQIGVRRASASGYALAPGESATARTELSRGGVCSAGRRARRAKLSFETPGRNDLGTFGQTKTVRVAGLHPLLRACYRSAR